LLVLLYCMAAWLRASNAVELYCTGWSASTVRQVQECAGR
jgi:hypothetical protein